METTEVKNTKELQELANELFTTLKPAKHEKDFTVSFTVYDYKHLMFIISDLMKLCVSAIEDGFDSDTVVFSKIHITHILEIAIELLPIDEAEFLDKSRELFLKENKNDIPEKQKS
ncbi:hypothetical protein [Flavobacterium yafengii]|uniref:hypothetical protein n=1 Tax=Flavobacterium yafengii TaxID=3041253 RepID=UPI0024A85D41|nr:hypothetical protein [Flavobacterium yafengii]MDI5886466.1 hypothetical protein [Flavobacterium yafengii]